MAATQEWTFFIDESGDFKKPAQTVCTAGPLLHLSADIGPLNLRWALQNAAPNMPWPLHTAHLGQPSMIVLANKLHAERNHYVLDDEYLEPFQALESRASTSVTIALERMRRERRPALKLILELDRELREANPTRYQQLLHVGREYLTGVKAVVEAVGLFGGRGAAATPPVAAVVASEGEKPDATVLEFGWPERTVRYFRLLDALGAHVKRLIAREPGGHRVQVQILRRDVWDTELRAVVPLHIRHLKNVPSLRPGDAGGPVRLVVTRVSDYDASADPACVLADFIAYHTRYSLQNGSGLELRAIEQHATLMVPLPLRSGPPDRSHFAAADPSGPLAPGQGAAGNAVWDWAREHWSEREALT